MLGKGGGGGVRAGRRGWREEGKEGGGGGSWGTRWRGAGKCPSLKILFDDLIAKDICCAFTFSLIAVPVF